MIGEPLAHTPEIRRRRALSGMIPFEAREGIMLLLGRRAFIAGLSGAALMSEAGALAQTGRRGFDLESALSQIWEGAFRYVPVTGNRNAGRNEHIGFRHWELRNRVLVESLVTRGSRLSQITRVEADGSFVITSANGLSRGQINPDGTAFLEGHDAQQRFSARSEFIGEGRTRIVTQFADGTIIGIETQFVPPDEALRLAARLYPAEYARPSNANVPARGQNRPGAASRAPVRRPEPQGAGQGRSALVIGAGNYARLPVLANPPNDARAVAVKLTELGYRVDLLIDPNRSTVVDALSRIRTRQDTSGRQTQIFYFAGHAIEIRGRNFLIGVDMPLSPSDIEAQAIPLDLVIGQLSADRISTRVIILDACRNGPARWPGVGRGLAQISAPQGTYVAYSTAPGMVATDGTGRNSPFTLALANELARPSQPIEAVFRSVRRSVVETTAGQQIPWDSSSLLEPFSFAAS